MMLKNILLSLFIGAMLTACGGGKTYSMDEWRAELKSLNGKSKEEVFAKLGKPCCGSASNINIDVYDYGPVVKDSATGNKSKTAGVVFIDGKLQGDQATVAF